jgi:histidine triad (HIT) family protein
MKQDCIFCKIAGGEIPSRMILESKDFYAFMDINPVNEGHSLVIPKEHCENILDFPKAEETDLIEFIKKVAAAVTKAVNADGFNLGMNNGKAAGQLVFHAHFHIIPRFESDGLHPWPHKIIASQAMEEIHQKIIKNL